MKHFLLFFALGYPKIIINQKVKKVNLKMKKTKSIIVFSIISSLFFTSCKKQDLEIGKTNISSNQIYTVSNVPYANDQELNAIAQNDNNVHFEIARKMALIDLELSIKQSMGWNGTNLSEKPVVIYDSKSEAKYYEFIVKNQNGEGLGTITTCAKKEADATVSHVLPYVRNYSSVLTKGSNYKIISGGYPNTLYTGVLSKSGEEASVIVDPKTGNVVTDVLTEDAKGMIEAIKSMTTEELSNMNVSNSSILIDQVVDKDLKNKEYAEKYWTVIDSIKVQLDTMTDHEILSAISSKGMNTWTSISEYVIPKYAQNNNLKATHWEGWCGPSALAIVYRGLFDSYKGFKLPINNDPEFVSSNSLLRRSNGEVSYYDFISGGDEDQDGLANDTDKDWIDKYSKINDGGLFADLSKLSGLYLLPNIMYPLRGGYKASQNAPTLPGPMSTALYQVTSGQYKMDFTLDVHDRIRSSALPAISLVDGMSHWVVAIGSKYEYWNWQVVMKIFKKNYIISEGAIRTNKWLYFHDNGYTIGKNNRGYLPYWENDKLSFYIDYAVKKV